jgi:hypothetical protein
LLSGESARHVTGARCPEAVSIVFAPSGDTNFNEPSTCPPIIEQNSIWNYCSKKQYLEL